ncbi:hypothetical protein H4R99_000787 [Coemansia sp. RSA 1722]|nr:hypothetical protein LPJ57_000132 [Coemansia sp. RSA 486]KAJ2237862.1 hypothetical protein IWW45_000604 [Coemansia sp. RSA 485]KAJ2603292.1 hypothetical protein GGF39_000245 [Coemansia sp. RSA 1721]KAJ2605922.1 hypothetical protein H4R99_000787 [Coemansia sp. RSA 1722]KAJ2639918.1 hypothetical protein GGF40_000446 [Coemansia sp. RSA 1286]
MSRHSTASTPTDTSLENIDAGCTWPQERRARRKHSVHARVPVTDALPTPPCDSCTTSVQQTQQMLSFLGADEVTSPSCDYSHMSLAEKVREANQALVYSWGKSLVGVAIRELCDATAPLRKLQLVSVIDMPANFCIAPIDEPMCPSDDPTRFIVVVNNSGIIVDTGMFDMDGPIFYKGLVVNNQYIASSRKSAPPRQQLHT